MVRMSAGRGDPFPCRRVTATQIVACNSPDNDLQCVCRIRGETEVIDASYGLNPLRQIGQLRPP